MGVVWAAEGPPPDQVKPHLSLVVGVAPDRALPQTVSSRMGNPLRKWSNDGRVKAREGEAGDKVVKAEGLALAVPLRALLETPAECQGCLGCLEEASRPEVLWEVQWGHPVVKFQGLP